MASEGDRTRSSGDENVRYQNFVPPRLTEPAKFLPVAFVSANIAVLWCLYTLDHLVPMMQSDDQGRRTRGLIECVCFQVVALLVLICYLRCILTDPGGLPPADEAEEAGERSQEVKQKGGGVRRCKWCRANGVRRLKPDRCHHCRNCGTCVLKMDHHCPWIYNCVGFRNYKYFFLLVFYSAMACIIISLTMIESIANPAPDPEGAKPAFTATATLLFGETLSAFLGILLTGLFGFHFWLMCIALTTIEFCEKSLKRDPYNSLYNLGFCGNVRAVLGPRWWLWLLPLSPPEGTGTSFPVTEHARLLEARQEKAGRASSSRRQGELETL